MTRAGIGRLLLALIAASLVLWPSRALAQGCAMCGTALKDSHDPLARSMASSIYFMLSMPFLIFFTVGGWLTYRFRRTAGRASRPADVPAAAADIAEENPS